MENNLWKNQISTNLKEAIQRELNDLLPGEIKLIKKRNEELEGQNARLRTTIERLKNENTLEEDY